MCETVRSSLAEEPGKPSVQGEEPIPKMTIKAWEVFIYSYLKSCDQALNGQKNLIRIYPADKNKLPQLGKALKEWIQKSEFSLCSFESQKHCTVILRSTL